MKNHIYLDYAASTPVHEEVLEAMMPYLKEQYGNPSSLHAFGQVARAAVEKAREQIAAFLGCVGDEIIFTGGASEANSLAILGVVKQYASVHTGELPHIVTSAIEHESVLGMCESLEKQGIATVSYVKPQPNGVVLAEDVVQAIQPNTMLVSVMQVNSQIGTIQPIAEIGEFCAQEKQRHNSMYPVFHTDAVQGVNFLDCVVDTLHVDLLTLSAHKIYGPKGVGVLYRRKGVPLAPIVEGGGQEMGMRSGTEHVAGIVGMGKAIEMVQSTERQEENKKMAELQRMLIASIQQNIPDVHITGSLERRIPNNVHVRIAGVSSYALVVVLDQQGVAGSAGSACSEKTQEVSHVLRAMGMSVKEAEGALRLTLGIHTSKEDIRRTAEILQDTVASLRAHAVH
jgi:cysteine desulfurase